MKARRIQLLVACGVALLAVGIVASGAQSQSNVDVAAKEIGNKVMSPFCPGYLLPDCPSAEARQLRELIRRKVAAGESESKIFEYLIEVYGPSVQAEPSKKGFNLLVWVMPFLAIAIGGVALVLIAGVWTDRRRAAAATETGTPPPSGERAEPANVALESKLDRELRDYDF